MQRVVEHTYVGLYIEQLLHRRSIDSVAQFCVNKTHCIEFPRPDWRKNKRQRRSQKREAIRQKLAAGARTPHTVPWIADYGGGNYDKPFKNLKKKRWVCNLRSSVQKKNLKNTMVKKG